MQFEAVPVTRMKYVMERISGDVRQVDLHHDFNRFLFAVSDTFDEEIESLHIYVLESSTSPWQDKIRLDTETFPAGIQIIRHLDFR